MKYTETVHYDSSKKSPECGSKNKVILTTNREEVTCRTCMRTLAFTQWESTKYQVAISLSKALPETKLWLESEPNRSAAIVKALNFYVKSLQEKSF